MGAVRQNEQQPVFMISLHPALSGRQGREGGCLGRSGTERERQSKKSLYHTTRRGDGISWSHANSQGKQKKPQAEGGDDIAGSTSSGQSETRHRSKEKKKEEGTDVKEEGLQ